MSMAERDRRRVSGWRLASVADLDGAARSSCASRTRATASDFIVKGILRATNTRWARASSIEVETSDERRANDWSRNSCEDEVFQGGQLGDGVVLGWRPGERPFMIRANRLQAQWSGIDSATGLLEKRVAGSTALSWRLSVPDRR